MSGRWAIAALLLLTPGCRPKPTLPALPEVDLTGTRGAVREAIESAMMAARSHPNDAALVARLGMVLHAHHQMASAARAYQRAAQLDPAQADYGDYLGTALAADGHYAQALEPLRASLQLRNSAPVRLRLANALYESGQRAEARVEYERLVAADATNAAAHYGLGRCLDGVAAAAEWQRAIELYPHYGGAKFALASLYRQAGRRAEAESLLENYERDKLLTPPLEDPALAAVEALDASATGLLRAARSLEHQGQVH